mmetsp:Transcript_102176/g.327694  ORF Transcript_102176/g.327694 Transcript_102176/m.327694 type:complete len:677 (-) Transcript_102176:306-2336(-)
MHSDFLRQVEDFCTAIADAMLAWEARHGAFDVAHAHGWLLGSAIERLREAATRDGAATRALVFTALGCEDGSQPAAIEERGRAAADRVVSLFSAPGEPSGTSIIHTGIHADADLAKEWKPEWSGEAKKELGIDPLAPMFLFLGRLASQRGPDLLIEAVPFILEARGDARFVLVGEGHMKAELEGRARELGVAHAVVFAGALRGEAKKRRILLRSCDALIAPSRSDPFGSAILEAWVAGKPVVATACDAPGGFLRAGEEGFLVEPDAGSVAWGVCKILENFQHAQWMGSRARQRALVEFNWAQVARATQQVYYEALGLDGAPFSRCPAPRCRTPPGDVGAPAAASASAATATLPTLAGALLDPLEGMTARGGDEAVGRGIAALRVVRLLATTLAGDASLTWMGEEFGHLSALDFPRRGNGFSEAAARVPFDVADAKGLRFRGLELFEACANRAQRALGWRAARAIVVEQDEASKVLVFVRGPCLFAFNLHSSRVQERLALAAGLDGVGALDGLPGELVVVLDTTDARFDGAAGTGEESPAARRLIRLGSSGVLELTLPPLSALVLAHPDAAEALREDPVLWLPSADAFVDLLAQAAAVGEQEAAAMFAVPAPIKVQQVVRLHTPSAPVAESGTAGKQVVRLQAPASPVAESGTAGAHAGQDDESASEPRPDQPCRMT